MGSPNFVLSDAFSSTQGIRFVVVMHQIFKRCWIFDAFTSFTYECMELWIFNTFLISQGLGLSQNKTDMMPMPMHLLCIYQSLSYRIVSYRNGVSTFSKKKGGEGHYNAFTFPGAHLLISCFVCLSCMSCLSFVLQHEFCPPLELLLVRLFILQLYFLQPVKTPV